MFITGLHYLICGDGYEVDCCGIASQFEYYTKNDGTIELMVWRPVASGHYDLVGSTSDTATGVGILGGITSTI